MGHHEHKKNALKKLNVGIITVSTTRTLTEDKSGQWMKKRAEKEGHDVVIHRVVGDDQQLIERAVWKIVTDMAPNILLITGGTGLNPTDVTIEAVRPMFAKELTAFGTLFTLLSYEEIDSAAILSRATAGVINTTTVFCLPGSLNACKLACKALIFPEAGHIAAHVNLGI
ncbi:MAG: molybdenum cofactor biosynthesis protein MoaB [Desulfobacteraceae bacterium]|nr:molybdenum cofactor biosynthesis protein MoaB [Desulfobacteraceae bacterium]MBC2757624.1 molybdenum cofactor biosynthesis protein MoaB [Desulfobacteraceae bacterium]